MQEMKEMRVQTLDWKDPLEKGMATHSSILAWRIPWRDGPGWLQSIMLQSLINWSDLAYQNDVAKIQTYTLSAYLNAYLTPC